MIPNMDIEDLEWADPSDVQAMFTTGAWSRDRSDRKRLLHWLAAAFTTCTGDLRNVLRRSLSDKEYEIVEQEMGPIHLCDVEIAQGAICERMNDWHRQGKLMINEEKRNIEKSVRGGVWARNYAESLYIQYQEGVTYERLLAQLSHIEDIAHQEMIVKALTDLMDKGGKQR